MEDKSLAIVHNLAPRAAILSPWRKGPPPIKLRHIGHFYHKEYNKVK